VEALSALLRELGFTEGSDTQTVHWVTSHPEIINLKNGGAATLTRQFKSKAKSAGEDIISPVVEQAAQAIVETVGK
jgi:hypothetical protein